MGLLGFFWRRRRPPLEVNRQTRRALARLSRKSRRDVSWAANMLRGKDEATQDLILARLPEEWRQQVRERLARPR